MGVTQLKTAGGPELSPKPFPPQGVRGVILVHTYIELAIISVVSALDQYSNLTTHWRGNISPPLLITLPPSSRCSCDE